MKITFQQTTIGYQEPIIRAIEVAVESPTLIGLVGDNGVGKSTLLRTLCRLVSPLAGNILVNGVNISETDMSTLSQHITFLPNGKSFYLNLTVQELLSLSIYNRALLRLDALSLDEYVLALVELFGIKELLHRKLIALSDGQYQLVSIVFALSRKTEVVLLDEPLAFLDFSNRKRFMEIFAELVEKEKRLVVFSSHDLSVLHKCKQLWHLQSNSLQVIDKEDIGAFCAQLLV